MICNILFSLLLFLFYKLSRIIIHVFIICIYVFSCNVLYRQRTHSLFAIDQCCQSLLCSVLYRAFILYRCCRSAIIFSVCNTFQDWRFCHIFWIFICCNKLCSKIIKIRTTIQPFSFLHYPDLLLLYNFVVAAIYYIPWFQSLNCKKHPIPPDFLLSRSGYLPCLLKRHQAIGIECFISLKNTTSISNRWYIMAFLSNFSFKYFSILAIFPPGV